MIELITLVIFFSNGQVFSEVGLVPEDVSCKELGEVLLESAKIEDPFSEGHYFCNKIKDD
jgi:hypothetical protein